MSSSYTVEAQLKATGVSQFQQAFANAEQSMSKMKEVGDKIGSVGKSLTKGVTLPVMALGTGVVAVGKQYEESMSKVQAISGATGSEMDNLRDTAREMGATTRYSASESADALGFMALAGWEVEEMTAALPGVLNLATAGGLELAAASDIVTDMMSMFGMEAEEAGKASDVFAQAQAKSNTNVEQLSEALLNAGPAASAAGASLEQTSAILGIFANQGVKGGRAGTALNAMYRDLKAGAEDGAIAIGESSVAVYDANGNMREMSNIMAEVEQATDGMTDAQRDSALSDVFKQQSLQGVNLLLNEGSGALKDLENEIYNSEGAAQGMADIMDDNLNGALANMKSALEEVALGFYDMAGGPMTTLIQKITELLQWFGGLSDETRQWVMVIGLAVAAIGPLLMGVNMLIAGISMLMSPIALVIVALGAFAAAVVYLWQTNETFREIVTEIWTEIQELFSVVWESISTIFTTTLEIIWTVVSDVFGNIKEFISENQEAIKTIVSTVWELIKTTIDTALKVISGIVETIMGVISGDWERAWNGIKTIVSSVWEGIKSVVSTLAEAMRSAVSEKVEAIRSAISEKFEAARSLTIEKFEAIRSGINEKMEAGKTIVTNAVDAIKGFFDINLYESGKAMISSVWDGVNAMKDNVLDKISGVASSIRDLWPFSPAKEGPLSDIHKMDFAGPIGQSIDNARNPIQKSMEGLAGIASGSFKPHVAIGGNVARSNAQVRSAVSHEINNSGNSRLESILNKIAEGQYIVLDSGELIGATQPLYDSAGGKQTKLTERWSL